MRTAFQRLAPLVFILTAPLLATTPALAATTGGPAVGKPVAGASVPAAQPPRAAPTPPPVPPVVVKYYPAAARAAGVEGQAVIRCARTRHLKLKDCTLVSEDPAGQGFGAAALAMAAADPENPKVDTGDAALLQPSDITVAFSLHPPGVSPDIADMAHMMTSPVILTFPTREQVKNAYPVRALSNNIEGVAALDCLVTIQGALSHCHIFGERPGGYGFGAAALDLAGDFKLKPRLVDGEPQADAPVRIPVPFTLTDPDAPLELQSAPPPRQ